MKLMDVAAALVEWTRQTFPEDIALIACYGSFVRGTARPDSDLDFFFIPATERGYDASMQFILSGVGFDFWPISWERAERIAAFDEPIVSVIADADVIYARSAEDEARFQALQARIEEWQQPAERERMLMRAAATLKDAYALEENVRRAARQADTAAVRREAISILTVVLTALAFINQTYYHAGWGANFTEVFALPKTPEGLETTVEDLLGGREPEGLVTAAERLIEGVRDLLLSEWEALPGKRPSADSMKGYYEEAKSSFNKINAACRAGDWKTALLTLKSVEDDVRYLLQVVEAGKALPGPFAAFECDGAIRKRGLLHTDLAFCNPDSARIQAASEALEQALVSFLEDEDVELRIFVTMQDFHRALSS